MSALTVYELMRFRLLSFGGLSELLVVCRDAVGRAVVAMVEDEGQSRGEWTETQQDNG